MGILESIKKGNAEKQEIWDKLHDYEALGMTEDDVDLELQDFYEDEQ